MRLWVREIIGLVIMAVAFGVVIASGCGGNDYDKAWDPDCHYKVETGTYFCPDDEEDSDES